MKFASLNLQFPQLEELCPTKAIQTINQARTLMKLENVIEEEKKEISIYQSKVNQTTI